MSELLTRFDFAWPWVWLLLPLPLLTRFLLPPRQPVSEEVRVPFLPELVRELRLENAPPASRWPQTLLFWLVWLLLLAALARPELLLPPQLQHKPMRNVVLVLDVSGSMAKNDAGAGTTRLQAVQRSVHNFVLQRTRDRIGLVIFASQAWPFAPISADKQALLARINQLAPGMVGQQTAIGDALGVAVKLLDSSLEQDASRMVILLTDGNDTASQLPPALAAQLAAEHQVQVDTIAFGDLNASGEDKVDSALMQDIARITGGSAFQAATSGSALQRVWQTIDAQTPAQVATLGLSFTRPLFAWPLGAALALLTAALLLARLRERAA